MENGFCIQREFLEGKGRVLSRGRIEQARGERVEVGGGVESKDGGGESDVDYVRSVVFVKCCDDTFSGMLFFFAQTNGRGD